MANHFVLHGSGVKVEYSTGGNPSFPSLTYTAGSTHKSFKLAEITSDSTGLGLLVSVSLVTSIDTGGERFGFFLPQVEVPQGETAQVKTVGIYDTFTGPDSFPHRPATWRCIGLTGTAQSVIVPLAQPAPAQ